MKEDRSKVTRRQMLRYLGSGALLSGVGSSTDLMAMLEQAQAEVPPGRVMDMPYRRFGQTDMELSPMGLGGLLAHYEGALGHPPDDVKRQIYLRAAELGVNLFDMGYGDEPHIPQELKGNRDDLHFSLKPSGGSPRASAVEGEIDRHLTNLQRDAIDILRIHQRTYVGSNSLAEKIAELKQAGKVRSLCLIHHYDEDDAAYAAKGPLAEADADLVMYSYVRREPEPGIAMAGEAGKAVMVMKALGGQYISWQDKTQTDWTQVTDQTVTDLMVRSLYSGEGAHVKSVSFGPWADLTETDQLVPHTDVAVRWVLMNPNVSTVLAAVASVEELEEVLGVGRPTSVRPTSWGQVKARRK